MHVRPEPVEGQFYTMPIALRKFLTLVLLHTDERRCQDPSPGHSRAPNRHSRERREYRLAYEFRPNAATWNHSNVRILAGFSTMIWLI